jgi:predicted ester cyclase
MGQSSVQPSGQSSVQPSVQTPDEKFVRDGFAYLNTRNLDAFFTLYSEDLRNPSLAKLGLPTDKDGFRAFVGGFYTSFSHPRFTPQTIVCSGDTAMFRWVFTGTHTGDFNGVKPTGKSVEIDCFTTFRMAPGGKIIEQHELGDMLSLFKQLGAIA